MEHFISSTKATIPSVDAILEEAWESLRLDKKIVRSNLGQSLVLMDEKATEIFRAYERGALLELAKMWLKSQKEDVRARLEKVISQRGWENFINEASKLFAEFGSLVQALEKDLGNMRKAREGKTFEKVIMRLLSLVNITAEIPTGETKEMLRRIDIVIPSIDIALKTPDRAVFLTCKRTLRERWKQEVPQAKLNQRIYLLTIDEELSESKAEEINEKGLIAFVRDQLKQRKGLKEITWIRRLSDLPKELQKL